MSASIRMPTREHWSPEVLQFAAEREIDGLLEPLCSALEQLFPTAQSVRIRLEEDPEIRDDAHVVFDVDVPRAEVPDFGAAKRSWHAELFRLCPAPLVCLFRLTLVRMV